MNTPDATDRCCALCRRSHTALTRHHLIPRMRHRNKRTSRLFAREQMRRNVLLLCRPCHKQIHAVISEKEMAARYHTREALLAHPEMRKFIEWIRTKPADFISRTYSMRRR